MHKTNNGEEFVCMEDIYKICFNANLQPFAAMTKKKKLEIYYAFSRDKTFFAHR